MEASILEFHLEYNPNRKNPAEVFHAMGHFIKAYEQFGKIIAQSGGSSLDFEVELQEVTHGCILARLVAKFEEWTNPENLIRELTGEISQAEQVAEITTKEKGRISKEFYRQDTRIEPYISDLDTARAMEEWSKGTAKLEANEHLKVCKNDQNLDNVIPFDPTFRFTGNLSKMYESFKARHDGEEIIELYSLQCKGDSKWDVKSRKTGKRYEAQITDYKWLSDYQRSKTRLGGNDCLRVHSAYDIVVVQGKEKIRNAVIVEVKEIITGTGFQNDLLE